jgi:L-rhamnose mutarotase
MIMKELSQHGNQGKAAAKAGVCRQTAAKYQQLGKLPSELTAGRAWRTRPDPFAAVWPEMLQALTDCGWKNYSIFLNEKEGTLIGYCEVDDFAAAQAKMSKMDVNTRWQEFMQPLFPQDKRADQSFENFVEVFHLA